MAEGATPEGFCRAEVNPAGEEVQANVAAGADVKVPFTLTELIAQYQSNEPV